MSRDVVIAAAIRTPVGKRNGAYRNIHPVDLSSYVLNELIARTGVDPVVVDDVVWGCVTQFGEQAMNIGRSAVLTAGWPESVPATTVDRQCGSSQQALHFAAAGVASGQYEVAVAGGVESMTRVPMGSSVDEDANQAFGPRLLKRYDNQEINQGLGAEMIAAKWGLSRQELDEFSLASHQKAVAAIEAGALEGQCVIVPGTDLHADEGVRPDTTLDRLAALRPAFKEDGVIHAGNSSQISDGSGALLVTTKEKARQLGLTPLVRVKALAIAGDDPIVMLTGPIPATAKVLASSGLSIDDIGAFEINEAFAPVPLAWLKETGAAPDRLNPLGGAIAVGHPLGGSGAVLMTRLVHHMVDNGIRYGLQSMCEGGGMANATILELL